MTSDMGVYGAEETAALGDTYRRSGQQSPASGETSVPEAPAKSQSRTRKLGPGQIAGTLCADPVMRFSQNGKAIVKARVAVSERHQDPATGLWSNGHAEFLDITVWGKQGEHVVESLRKGDRVVATGIWEETVWTGKDDEEHTTRYLSVRDIGPSLMFRQARVVRNQERS